VYCARTAKVLCFWAGINTQIDLQTDMAVLAWWNLMVSDEVLISYSTEKSPPTQDLWGKSKFKIFDT